MHRHSSISERSSDIEEEKNPSGFFDIGFLYGFNERAAEY
jgi:hypothetical protein